MELSHNRIGSRQPDTAHPTPVPSRIHVNPKFLKLKAKEIQNQPIIKSNQPTLQRPGNYSGGYVPYLHQPQISSMPDSHHHNLCQQDRQASYDNFLPLSPLAPSSRPFASNMAFPVDLSVPPPFFLSSSGAQVYTLARADLNSQTSFDSLNGTRQVHFRSGSEAGNLALEKKYKRRSRGGSKRRRKNSVVIVEGKADSHSDMKYVEPSSKRRVVLVQNIAPPQLAAGATRGSTVPNDTTKSGAVKGGFVSRYKLQRKAAAPLSEGSSDLSLLLGVQGHEFVPAKEMTTPLKEATDKRRRRTSSSSGKFISKYKMIKVCPSGRSASTLENHPVPLSVSATLSVPAAVPVQPQRSHALSRYKFVKSDKNRPENKKSEISIAGVAVPTTTATNKLDRISKYRIVRSKSSPCIGGAKSKSPRLMPGSKITKYKLVRNGSTPPSITAFKKARFVENSTRTTFSTVLQRSGSSFKVTRTKLRRISASEGARKMLSEGAKVVQKGDFTYAVTSSRLKRMSSSEVNRLPPRSKPKALSIARARSRSLATLTWIKKKSSLPCIFLVKFGKCARQESGKCPYDHTPKKADVKKVMPVCQYFLEGRCGRGEECPYPHVKHGEKTPICLSFISGKCLLGDKCNKRHENICKDFKTTGKCQLGRLCPLKHIKIVRKAKKDSFVDRNKAPEQFSEAQQAPPLRYFEQAAPKSEVNGNVSVSDDLRLKRERLLKRIQDMKAAVANTSSDISSGTSVHTVSSESGVRPPLGKLPDFIALN